MRESLRTAHFPRLCDTQEHILAEPEGPELDVVLFVVGEALEGARSDHLYPHRGERLVVGLLIGF